MCSESIMELLSGHIDHMNTPQEESRLQSHLTQCAECRALLAQMEEDDALLAQIPVKLPEDFSQQVIAKLPRKSKRKLPFRYGTVAAAAVAAILLCVNYDLIPLPQTMKTALPIAEEANLAEEPEACTPTEETQLEAAADYDEPNPGHIDVQALADAESCYVGVWYTDRVPDAVLEAPSLAVSGGKRYQISARLLRSLSEEYPDIAVYSPKEAAADNAYLLVLSQ